MGEDYLSSVINNLSTFVWSESNVFSPLYVLLTALVAILTWAIRRPGISVLSYLFPASVYRHASTMTDLKLCVFNFVFVGAGTLSFLFVSPFISYAIAGEFSERTTAATPILLGTVIFLFLALGVDFGRYLGHRVHHNLPILWPYHAVHHSAEVLTPLTAWRVHPVYFMVNQIIVSAIVGVVNGVAIGVIAGQPDRWVFLGPVVVTSIYFISGAHLRHSHIWLSYPVFLQHVLISPAQHQVHHSVAPQHRERNFGEVFALWDWMFGTLYITRGHEELLFGLSDDNGLPLPQAYPNLRAALARPFVESIARQVHTEKQSDSAV